MSRLLILRSMDDSAAPSADRQPPFIALRAFEAAARRLSFARAAEELGVSPSAISQQIQQLEGFAGQPLFRRLGRSIELTEAGAAALPLLTQAMAGLAEGARLMRLPLRARRVTLSAPAAFAAKWLAPRLARFHAALPEIDLRLRAEGPGFDLASADIDLAIRFGPGGPEDPYHERLMDEHLTPACAPALAHGVQTPADLARLPLLHDDSPDRDSAWPGWAGWFEARGVAVADPWAGLRFDQPSLVIEAAVAGAGAGLVRRSLAAGDFAAGRLVAPFPEEAAPLAYAYWMSRPRGRTMGPALREVIGWLRAEAGAEAPADLGAGI